MKREIEVTSPMSGKVVMTDPGLMQGFSVRKGQFLVSIERMKLICDVDAPCDGVVSQVFIREDDEVREGETLLTIVS